MTRTLDSLLPSTPSYPVVEALDDAVRAGQIEKPTFNVDDAPVEWLPQLAWNAQADMWTSELGEEISRELIRIAPIIHRHRFKPYAIDVYMKALGISWGYWWNTGVDIDNERNRAPFNAITPIFYGLPDPITEEWWGAVDRAFRRLLPRRILYVGFRTGTLYSGTINFADSLTIERQVTI